MSDALTALGAQSGLTIIVETNVSQGITATALSGQYTPEEALKRLLEPAGLRAEYLDSKTVAVRRATEEGADDTAQTRGIEGGRNTVIRTAQSDTSGPNAYGSGASGDQTSDSEANGAGDRSAGVQEIVVTGSRAVRDGSRAPSPLTVLGADWLERRASQNIADALNELPAFQGSTTPGSSAVGPRNPGANYVNLRNLGANRTLVLIDGIRHVPSQDLGQVDLNLIPAALVERVDVVTGGASAVYGSDAVAGVVNLVLKRKVEGLQLTAEYGASQENDEDNYHAALLGGTSFAQDRGYITVALDFFKSQGAGDVYTRDWGRKEYDVLVNPVVGALPVRVISANGRSSTMTPGGLITSGPLRGTAFAADGTPYQFQYGTFAGAQKMIGGEGFGDTLYRDVRLMPPRERRVGYLRAGYNLTDEIEAFLDLSAGHTEGISSHPYLFNFGNLSIRRSNAFLPESIATAMDENGLTSFAFGRFSIDLGKPYGEAAFDTRRIAAGLKGSLGGTWTWDANVQHGTTDLDHTLHNAFIPSRVNEALDAVVGPDSTIVCRSSLANPASPCRPLNFFGEGRSSPEAVAYVTGDEWQQQTQKQTSAALGVAGNLFETSAGPITAALGVEYREDSLTAISDPLSAAGLFSFGNPRPIDGRVDAKEAYAEVAVPLLEDLPMIKALGLNSAARYTDYSTSGGVTTWKVGTTWDVVSSLRIRATRSHDVRAPNIPELFQPNRPGLPAVIIDPFRNNANSIVFTNLLGNPNLSPEAADTTSFGIVFNAPWDSRLRGAINYFDIDVQDSITTVPGQDTVDRCFRGEAVLCEQIVRDATTGAIASINTPNINIARARTRGIDLELSYNQPVRVGNLDLRLFATRVLEVKQTNGQNVTNLDGQNNGVGIPTLVATGLVSYQVGDLTLTAQAKYLSSGTFDNSFVEGLDINDNSLPSATYVNLSGQYDIAKSFVPGDVRLLLNVNNLFDREPAPVPSTVSETNQSYYDAIGRSFRVGVQVQF